MALTGNGLYINDPYECNKSKPEIWTPLTCVTVTYSW